MYLSLEACFRGGTAAYSQDPLHCARGPGIPASVGTLHTQIGRRASGTTLANRHPLSATRIPHNYRRTGGVVRSYQTRPISVERQAPDTPVRARIERESDSRAVRGGPQTNPPNIVPGRHVTAIATEQQTDGFAIRL